MLVVASRKNDVNHRIYHRCGCIYARRIKPDNRKEMSVEKAQRKHYQECKFCAGLHGDVRVHKTAFETWSRKKKSKIYIQGRYRYFICSDRDWLLEAVSKRGTRGVCVIPS